MKILNVHEVAENRNPKKVILSESQLRCFLKEIASTEIDERAKDVDLTPTDAQKEAGNYKMAHISVKGMEIAIENPKGSKRYFTDEKTGEKRYVVMNNHYGYFNITKGKDGDAVDVFIGPDIDNFDNVYCVDQNNKAGEFDETKVMLGFTSKEQAKASYMSNYDPNWRGFRAITGVSLKHFKKWLYRGRKQRQPFADYVYIQKKKITESKEGNPIQQAKFQAKVKEIEDYIKAIEGVGGPSQIQGTAKGIKTIRTNYNNMWLLYHFGGVLKKGNKIQIDSFISKAVNRALTNLKQQGVKLNYYTGV